MIYIGKFAISTVMRIKNIIIIVQGMTNPLQLFYISTQHVLRLTRPFLKAYESKKFEK